MSDTATTASSRYEQLVTHREPYLSRAREVAELTLPTLLPREGASGGERMPAPFQSLGSRGVNHLGAKLLLALFPPGGSFFRFDIDAFLLAELAAEAEEKGIPVEDARAEFDQALSQYERAVVTHMEQKSARATLSECLKHLIVAGNVLMFVEDDARFRLYHLPHYVVKRDRRGIVLEIIVKETMARASLPEEIKAHLAANPSEGQDDNEATIDVFTWVKRDGKRYTVHQETGGIQVADTDGEYPEEKCPWIALRWTKIDGEDYGRGHGEEYLGDLKSLEAMTQAIVEYAGIAAKTLFFVNEAGLTSKKEVAESANGAILDGDAKDVTVLRVEKLADFQVVKSAAEEMAQRLSQAYLLFNQRDAERVTAEEIRVLAGELEQALGGVYSILAQELQRPLVAVLTAQLQKSGALPALPSGTVTPQITTGLEGLGRNNDLFKLEALLRGLGEVFGPAAVVEYVNPGAYLKRKAAALGIDIKGLIRSDDEVAGAKQQAQQQALTEKLGPGAISAAAGIAKQELTNQPAPTATNG